MGAMKQIVTEVLDLHSNGSTIGEISEVMGLSPNEVGFIVVNFDEDPNYPDCVADPNTTVAVYTEEFDDIPF